LEQSQFVKSWKNSTDRIFKTPGNFFSNSNCKIVAGSLVSPTLQQQVLKYVELKKDVKCICKKDWSWESTIY